MAVEQLKESLDAVMKINNITGYLPLNIENMLPIIQKEMDKIFAPFISNINLYDNKRVNYCQADASQCKVYRDQLPLILEQGQPHHCCPGRDCRDRTACSKTKRSHICVPLIAGADMFGVITLKGIDNDQLSRDSLELLLAIANQVAATVQRSKLYNRLAQEKKNLENANQEISQLNSVLINKIAELKKMQEQLVFAEKLAATGRLAANLSHEINNPTGIILSRLEWLFMEFEERIPADMLQDLLVIKKHTERIAFITRSLLSFSSPIKTEDIAIDPGQLIQDTVGWMERQFAKKNIDIRLELNSTPLINGSPELLEQVLVNLLTNAKDALPDGGTITMRTNYMPGNSMVQIDIQDNGEGIVEEHKDMIFDPFFSTKGKQLGTGLGLPTSLAIIKEHGGSMEFNSVYGEGTCFSIILPVSIKEEAKLGQ